MKFALACNEACLSVCLSVTLCLYLSLFSFCRTNAVNYEGPWMCNDRCHQVQNCAIGNVDYDDYRMCVTQAKALSANHAQSVVAPRPDVIGLLLVFGLAIIAGNSE